MKTKAQREKNTKKYKTVSVIGETSNIHEL